MKLLCKIFGHRYKYHIIQDCPERDIRHCKTCHIAEELKTLPVYGKNWFQLVSRTTEGAKAFMKSYKRIKK